MPDPPRKPHQPPTTDDARAAARPRSRRPAQRAVGLHRQPAVGHARVHRQPVGPHAAPRRAGGGRCPLRPGVQPEPAVHAQPRQLPHRALPRHQPAAAERADLPAGPAAPAPRPPRRGVRLRPHRQAAPERLRPSPRPRAGLVEARPPRVVPRGRAADRRRLRRVRVGPRGQQRRPGERLRPVAARARRGGAPRQAAPPRYRARTRRPGRRAPPHHLGRRPGDHLHRRLRGLPLPVDAVAEPVRPALPLRPAAGAAGAVPRSARRPPAAR